MPTGPHPPADDPAALLRDWMTLVQTELAGLASDREALETWQGLLAMWAQAAHTAMAPHDPRQNPPGPAPAAAAPAAERPAVDALLARIAGLERRVAELERQPHRKKPTG